MEEKMKKIMKGKEFCDYLESQGINYEWCIKHKEVLGCDESSLYYEHYKYYIGDDYCICKNLFLQERKGDKRLFLLIVPNDKKVDLKEVKERFNTSKLEFVKESVMEQLLHTTPGNISIFNLIYDKEQKINLILDQDIFDSSLLAFHPLYNGMSLFLDEKNIIEFLSFCHREYIISDVPAKDDELLEKRMVLTK